jgi:hypothetical protein
VAVKFLDRNHPMFRRKWVKLVSVGLPAIWALVEFGQGNPFWGLIFGALAAYAAYELYLRAAD